MPSRAERIAIVACCLLALTGCREQQRPDDAAPPKKAKPLPTTPDPDKPVRIIYPAAPGSFVDLAEDLRPSIVHLAANVKVAGGPASMFPGAADDYALGTGFLVDADGHIVTNDHVVKNAPELRVKLWSGSEIVEMAANVIGRDPKLDLAVLKIDANPRLKPVRLGDSDTLQAGEWVVALGNPFGDEMTVSAGIVNSVGRTSKDRLAGPSPYNFRAYLQTDARITPGNSGGPLVNTAGEVVGVATAIKGRDAGIGFALPINRVKPLLPQLIEEGTVSRAFLGIFIHPVTRQLAAERGMETVTGALVSDVVVGGPAAKAGIKAGDIILKYAGKEVDHRNFPWISASSGIGQRLEVVVWRSGGPRVLSVVPEAMPK
jgi:S1-C subfamily serine protease